MIAAFCLAALGVASFARADDSANQLATAAIYLQSGTGHEQGEFVGNFDLATIVGANRLYSAGFDGTRAVMANIEAGYAWSGHETLTHVGQIPLSPGAAGEVDRHATWVAMVMGGRPTSSDPANSYQRGLAPGAQLLSGAIATGWPNSPSFPRYTANFNVSFSDVSTFGSYRFAFQTGISIGGQMHPADVINSSWVANSGSSGLTATDRLAGTLDALINENPRTLLTLAAGNTLPSGEGPNRVPSPASAFNALCVAALGPNGGAFDVPSFFSNGGPNDYTDPTIDGSIVPLAHQVVDIAAPGENFSTAYYGGETGGNGPNLFGPPGGPAGGPDWYSRNVSGTSFAAPTVAGGAALLYDAAYARLSFAPDARDARVMKAVLMNSADKTLGWDNGQTPHPNGHGGVTTTRGLDNRVGAGRMNLSRAFEQLLWGTTDVAGTAQGNMDVVSPIGWDFGLVTEGTPNDYLFDNLAAGSRFNATLDWFRDRQTVGETSYADNSYDDLDLELWEVVAGVATHLIAESKSQYNNVEHFSFNLPRSGSYLLRVLWTSERYDLVGDANSAHYGLAWSVAVPEPATLALLLAAVLPAVRLRERRGRCRYSTD